MGTINQQQFFKYVPAVILLNKTTQVGSANEIKNGKTINEQQRVKLIASAICFFNCAIFLLLCNSVRFGTIAIASEPINVEGMESSGSVMPIAIPNWLKACSFVNPADTNRNGSKNAIKGCERLVNSLTKVIGAEDLTIG